MDSGRPWSDGPRGSALGREIPIVNLLDLTPSEKFSEGRVRSAFRDP